MSLNPRLAPCPANGCITYFLIDSSNQDYHTKLTTPNFHTKVVMFLDLIHPRTAIQYLYFLLLIVRCIIFGMNIFDTYNISGIAYTAGPGLERSLAIGATFSCSLAYSLNIPSIGLIISGAHTQLVLANALGKYKILGDCLDDALGEAFDKTANLLGISYPGDDQTRCDIARAFEDAILDTIEIKCRRALNFTQCKNLVVSGGVSANNAIRKRLHQKHFNLIENLAEEILNMLITIYSVSFIKVTVNKPSAILEASNIWIQIALKI
uniref:N(6)-L-threonylcarbamoyladenine synthase n=1 Tax=Glossina austeni TaxID=7395 RepID=A0A1A9UKF1_GLOAU